MIDLFIGQCIYTVTFCYALQLKLNLFYFYNLIIMISPRGKRNAIKHRCAGAYVV